MSSSIANPGTMDDATDRKQQAEVSGVPPVKRECLSFTVSLQEGFRYVKAFFVGQGKKLTAKNEKEAAEAELLTAKMQVDATDAAEDSKNRLNKSV